MAQVVKRPGKTARKKGRSFPPEYRLLSPIQKMGWLQGDEAKALVASRRIQHNQIEAEKSQLRKAYNRIARKVPSPGWLSEFQNGGTFPPPADNHRSEMRQARHVLKPDTEDEMFWPHNYLNGVGATYDVVLLLTEERKRRMGMANAGGTESPSADVIQKLRSVNGIVIQKQLLTEDEAALKRQIARYGARRKITV